MNFTIKSDLTDEILAEKNESVLKAMRVISMKAEGYAKKSLTDSGAVDTGRLRGSVTGEYDGNGIQVGTNVEYGPYIELGTYKMRARPYIRPSIADHIQEYQEILKRILKGT